VVGPAYFTVEYHPVREGYELRYVGLVMRPPLTQTPRCPKFVEKSVTCTVDVHGEMRMIRRLPGSTRDITLTRRHHDAEVEVTSQSLDEPGLRRLLNTLHPLSNTDLERLMREKVITRGYWARWTHRKSGGDSQASGWKKSSLTGDNGGAPGIAVETLWGHSGRAGGPKLTQGTVCTQFKGSKQKACFRLD
jgi:hypothetical protein